MSTDPWGIDSGYHDVDDRWHPVEGATRDALRTAMRASGEAPPAGPPLRFVVAGTRLDLEGPHRLVAEDGADLGMVSALPPDLPVGWYRIEPDGDGPATTLAVHPRKLDLPPGLRAWLWSAQLYATRSATSWGIGDLGDLALLGGLGQRTGASMTGVNPLFDARTEPTCETSPYFPSSRRWLHPLWLRIEDVPGAAALLGPDGDLEELARAGRALNEVRHIDRDAVWALKRPALERLWRGFASGGFDAEYDDFLVWRRAQGPPLEDHARFRALADRHGPDWRRWPLRLRSVTSPAVERAAADAGHAVDFWAWVQWLLDRQLAAANQALPLLADLPVGVDPGGADAWRWRDLLASGVRVGAPPDKLGPGGQDWGVAPFIPWALRAAHYRPLVEMVRGVCLHAGALRIDHVMGLFRLFWIPPGAGPESGGYVRFPGDELLDVVLLEAARSGTMLVGEDLGTVEPGVRDTLREREVLGTRLVWFEDEPPAGLPESCLASISTHDLPTVAGLWTGADAADARSAGVPVDEQDVTEMHDRLATAAGVGPHTEVADVVADATAALAESPARLVAVSFDDGLAVPERPNVPGTTDVQRPNWSIALPLPIEDFEAQPLVQRCAEVLSAARPAPAHSPPSERGSGS